MKNRLVLLAATAAAAFGVSSAFAADLPVRSEPPAPFVPAVPIFTWTGFYVGGHMGYAGGNSNWTANPTQAGLPSSSGSVDMFLPLDDPAEAGQNARSHGHPPVGSQGDCL